ncbi:response regulator transcription factor [Anaerolineales bacterium HSG6]|nr:response regulator transcription factor [Anaerolineales bacterium HSG6]MDM8529930.1 response regulator transcription factor [Anaerolineales bacterium HSG25]
MNSSSIRVMIVDDHAVVRSGLSTFLLAFDDLDLVGEASNGIEALQKCAIVKPDVILMDIVMPKMDGPTATKAIRKKYPHIQIVALTSFKEDDLMYQVLEAGAIGYLLKNVAIDELANAIRAAHAGQSTLAPEATQTLLLAATHSTEEPSVADSLYNLTERELEVLTFMTKGLTNPQIAKKLFVSRSTVRFHASNLFSKLGVSNRSEAAALAIEHSLIHRQ